MLTDIDFVFIIGAARSGTTWLQALLAAHGSICSTIDELKLFDFFTVPLEDGWKYLLSLQSATGGGRNGLAAIWTDRDFYDFLTAFISRVYQDVLAFKAGATVLLDKAPAYSLCVEHINRLIPHAKFIHIVRDGRDVAVSLMAAAQGWGSLWAPKDMQAAAAYWKNTVLAARNAQQYGDRYLEVRYEELLTNGVPVLQRLFEFIGVPVDSADAAEIYNKHRFEKMRQAGTGTNNFALPTEFFRKGAAGDWRNALSRKQRYLFHETAGDLLCTLGYADSSWWFDHRHEQITVPLLLTLSSRSRMRMQAACAIRHALGANRTQRLRSDRQPKQKLEIPQPASNR